MRDVREQPWRDEAACRGLSPSIFYPDDEDATGPAKAVCAECPVRGLCLDYALAFREPGGVWGGLNERERRGLVRRRQAAARRGDAPPPAARVESVQQLQLV